MRRLNLGEAEATHLPGGRFRLDGGTMFGVVPKAMWQRQCPPDADNRIQLACNCLLLEIGRERILIDTGIGERFSDRERAIYGIDSANTLQQSLAAANCAPANITQVVFTHLHFDHFCGSLVAKDNQLVPLFPNAKHLIQNGEWQDALAGRSTMKSSYRPDEFRILEKLVEIRLLHGSEILAPGLETFIAGGHTQWHQGLRLQAGGKTLVYPGEMIPTRSHLPPYWNMAYDMFPHKSLSDKRAFTAQAAAERWIVAWDHDPDTPWSLIRQDGDALVAVDFEQ
jgi:glyoxylase-like metal-dependent hydrolase (beta-lactamase superfamily II)